MKNYEDLAEELFLKGYNCAQSVFCAFCEEFNIDFETGLKMSSSLGGGMGRLREICGAVSSMFLIAGLKYGYTDISTDEAKINHYKLIQELAKRFQKEAGSIICRELIKEEKNGFIPEKRTEEYYKKSPCAKLVKLAAKITKEMLEAPQ